MTLESILTVSLEPARPQSAAQTHLSAIADGLTARGYRVTTLWRSEDGALAGLPGFALSLPRRVREADLVYVRWHALDALTPALCRLFRRPLVLEVNGLPDDLLTNRPGLRPLAPAIRAVNRFAFRHSALVICASSGLAETVGPSVPPATPVVVVRNGAHPPQDAAAESVPPRAGPYVLYFGDLSSRQGLEHLLRVRLSHHWPTGGDLVVAGDGPLRPLVQAHADRGDLTFLGRMPTPALGGWVRGAAATLSLQDPDVHRNVVMGLPLKVTESLMLGTPVIATPLSDVPAVTAVQPPGMLVDPRDEEDVCRAVRESLRIPDEARAEIARRAREELSWDRAVEETIAALRSLVGDHPAPTTLR